MLMWDFFFFQCHSLTKRQAPVRKTSFESTDSNPTPPQRTSALLSAARKAEESTFHRHANSVQQIDQKPKLFSVH